MRSEPPKYIELYDTSDDSAGSNASVKNTEPRGMSPKPIEHEGNRDNFAPGDEGINKTNLGDKTLKPIERKRTAISSLTSNAYVTYTEPTIGTLNMLEPNEIPITSSASTELRVETPKPVELKGKPITPLTSNEYVANNESRAGSGTQRLEYPNVTTVVFHEIKITSCLEEPVIVTITVSKPLCNNGTDQKSNICQRTDGSNDATSSVSIGGRQQAN